MEILNDAPMSKYTSFRCGGSAKRLVICETVSELKEIMNEITESKGNYLFLGNGSNTLFLDGEYDGTVVTLGKGFDDVELVEEADGPRLKCMAASLLSKIARKALAESLAGFEFASGIPGSIGGAVFMNAGAYGGEIIDVLESVELLSPNAEGRWELKTVPAEELELAYRHSRLQETRELVVSTTLRLTKGDRAEIEAKLAELTKKRTSKQPLEFPSAGSFFKRPEGHFAAKLIEDAGLKGVSVGGAQISSKHCGFMINTGGATTDDIVDLMHLVQNTVFDKFGVKLEPEVRIIGL